VPVTTSEGYRLGTVTVLGAKPGEATQEQFGMLTDLGAIVMDGLELRLSAMNTLRGARRALT
jgi:sigma-B regulation protein RsbU (phosphoserine phosphatase)